MNGIFVIQFLINDFMFIKAEHEKIYINALAHSRALLVSHAFKWALKRFWQQVRLSNYISWGRVGPIFSCRLIMK